VTITGVIGYCLDCGRKWSARGEAHCAMCCRHFSSDSAFDRHLAAPDADENCYDPATLTKKNGQPAFVLTERASGPMWMEWDEREHPFAKARRESGKRSESPNSVSAVVR
jgi:hypothetical protein